MAQLFFLIALMGILFGSFLTTVVFRSPKKENFIWGRSRCPHCRHDLGALDLIPIVSYLLRLGRCAYCKTRISPLYPMIEISTFLAFIAAFFLSGVWQGVHNAHAWILLFCLLVLFSLFIVLFFTSVNQRYR